MIEIQWTTGFTTVEKALAPAEAVLAGYGLFLYSRITRRLRERHPEAWRALGSPVLFSGTATAGGLATVQYLLGGAHRDLGDNALERLTRRWLWTNILFIAGLLVLIYQILRYGP